MAKILYAITGHGFGHATRSLAIARLLKQQYPDLELTISSAVDAAAIKRFVPDLNSHFTLRGQDYEPGVAQLNCFEVDPEATIEQYRQLSGEIAARVAAESRYLARGGYDGVISDIAAIPLAAAAGLGIPSLVVGNFTWDWILEPIIQQCAELSSYLQALRSHYATAELYLRLPFGAPEHPCRRVEEAPMIGRRSVLSKEMIYSKLGIAQDRKRPLILVAVGGWHSEGLKDITIEGCEHYRFLVVGDLPIKTRKAELFRIPFSLGSDLTFPDLVHIADAGVVKPGYGTCSEFVLNRAAMVGIERRNMRETTVLDHKVCDYIPFAPLSLQQFFAGNWQQSLESVLAKNVPQPDDAEAHIEQMLGRIGETLQF